MSLAAQSVSVLMLLCVVPILVLTAYTAMNREQPGARGLLLALIGTAGWTIVLALLAWPQQVLALHINTAFRQTFQFMTAFGWLLFVFEYIRGQQVSLRRWYVPALLIIPAVTISLTVTNPTHHLVIAEGALTNPAGIAEIDLGPWYPVFVVYTTAVVGVPIVVLLYEFRSAHGQYRKQLLLMMGGWAVGVPGALSVHALRSIDAVPAYVDFTPLAFVIAAVMWSTALFRYDLFAMVPVSRRRAVETIDAPIISVDPNGTVVDANPAAQALCGAETSPVGTPFESFCEPFPSLIERYRQGGTLDEELTLDVDGTQRHFSMSMRPTGDDTGDTGTVIVLQETTALRERERELELLKQVLSRVFRHNVRNDLNLIEGHTELIAATDETGQYTEHTTAVLETTKRLISHSEKAADLRDIIDAPATETIQLHEVTHRVVDSFAADHPNVEIEATFQAVAVRAHPALDSAVTELLTNARAHFDGPAEELQIAVRTAQSGDSGRLVVADNGPGIDQHEIDALDAGEETVLQHASGVGLWLIQLIVDRSGGSMTIDDDPALGGTRVEITLPLADDERADDSPDEADGFRSA